MADSVFFISSTDAKADAAEIGASAVLEMKADKKPATLAAAAAMPIIDRNTQGISHDSHFLRHK